MSNPELVRGKLLPRPKREGEGSHLDHADRITREAKEFSVRVRKESDELIRRIKERPCDTTSSQSS